MWSCGAKSDRKAVLGGQTEKLWVLSAELSALRRLRRCERALARRMQKIALVRICTCTSRAEATKEEISAAALSLTSD